MGTSPDFPLDIAAAETLPIGFRRPPEPTAPAPIPERVGRYEVRGLVGEGAMGRVYRAYDPRMGREVAVKTLKAPFATNERALLRLKREAEVVGLFSHPSLLPVFDVGRDYIVQELAEGESLAARLARAGALPALDALPILSAIAEGLDHIHARGVVHRDIKPANVMLVGSGRARIADFGVAHLAWSSLTGSHDLIGSPAYMAPEQITAGAVGPPSDLYALAVVAFEALTGVHPFPSATVGRLLESIVRDAPSRASRLGRALPRAVDDVFAVALAKDPPERYGSGRIFMRKLGVALESSPTLVGLWAWITGRRSAAGASAPVSAPRGTGRERPPRG
jgi:serine/threonine-protein kinase